MSKLPKEVGSSHAHLQLLNCLMDLYARFGYLCSVLFFY